MIINIIWLILLIVGLPIGVFIIGGIFEFMERRECLKQKRIRMVYEYEDWEKQRVLQLIGQLDRLQNMKIIFFINK